MKAKDVVFGLCLGLLLASCLDLWLEPFEHKRRVNFWEWARRELVELLTFER